jgi:hypothetical protein
MEVKELVRFVKSLQFSWDNLTSGNERIMGRLDIVYVSKCIKDRQECQVFIFTHLEEMGSSLTLTQFQAWWK